jgi:hypothetical protein
MFASPYAITTFKEIHQTDSSLRWDWNTKSGRKALGPAESLISSVHRNGATQTGDNFI